MEHLDPDQLVLLALGEQTDGKSRTGAESATPDADDPTRRHLLVCALCRRELEQFTRTVELARQAGDLGLHTPLILPSSIWLGISEELGIGSAASAREADRPFPVQRDAGPALVDVPTLQRVTPEPAVAPSTARGVDRRGAVGGRRPVRRALLVAAAVVAIGAAVAGGVVIGRPAPTASAPVQSEAALMPMPAGPSTAHGTATITQTADGLTLNVAARQLPLRQGYYEVWLYDPTANQMVAVGTLGAGGDGVWTLASTIDLRSYSVVDVSAQDFDGNPAHKDSVLRGALTQ